MRSEIRTALAVLATAAVLMGSATMALAADGEVEPDPTVTTTTTSPNPSQSTTPGGTASTPTPDPSESAPDPTTPSPDVPTGAFNVSNAQMRWGINNESNNNAFAPGTANFFSAGKIADPGGTNVKLTAQGWRQAAGNVTIEKFLNGAYRPATWSGLTTTSDNTPMRGTNGPFSNHQVVISGGKGTVDPKAKKATIQWSGSFTVLYYSGYSFFYVTDPKLTVVKGKGTLTVTLSGFGASMDDPDQWDPIKPVKDVVLANLGTVDLGKELGFTATPAYSKVAVSVPRDQVQQVKSGTAWGSFPQSFVNYQTTSGTGSYWYSSGGAADAHKTALPVTVSYAAGKPVPVKKPSTKGNKTPDMSNDAPSGPAAPSAVSPPNAAAPPVAALSMPAPAPGDVLQRAAALQQAQPVSTVLGLRPVSADVGKSADTGIWILGGVVLLFAMTLVASPYVYSAIRSD